MQAFKHAINSGQESNSLLCFCYIILPGILLLLIFGGGGGEGLILIFIGRKTYWEGI